MDPKLIEMVLDQYPKEEHKERIKEILSNHKYLSPEEGVELSVRNICDNLFIYEYRNKETKVANGPHVLLCSETGEISIGSYKNDNLDGKCIILDQNGNIEETIDYVNGKKEGINVRYSLDNEHSKEVRTYHNGVIHGLYKLYYKNGKKKVEGYYDNGRLDRNKKLIYNDKDGNPIEITKKKNKLK